MASACSVELALGVVLSFCFNEYLLSLVCLEKYIYSDKYVILNKCHFYFPSSKAKGTTCISREDNLVKFKNLNTFSFSQMKTIKLAQLHCGRVFRFFFKQWDFVGKRSQFNSEGPSNNNTFTTYFYLKNIKLTSGKRNVVANLLIHVKRNLKFVCIMTLSVKDDNQQGYWGRGSNWF